MEKYIAEFTNEYGEDWVFEYDYSTGNGVIKGSDVDWNEYPIIDGKALGLVLAQSEIEWLRSCWLEATADSQDPGSKEDISSK
ncbi:MAG TPA: hypothetical protein ENI15_06960 [Spirochaetes bacterium]|nr:hypothetical protein [Spirochaetota bacterium]